MNKLNIGQLDFDKLGGIIPAIIQDAETKTVLMLGFMDKEALNKTIKNKKVTFWSRTKKRLWEKGESSGNTLEIISIATDCDNDTLLILVSHKVQRATQANILVLESKSRAVLNFCRNFMI